jgi:hypothetical protein
MTASATGAPPMAGPWNGSLPDMALYRTSPQPGRILPA